MAQPKDTFAGSVFGKITDFNVWNYDVDDEDILKWTTCENNKKGNLVDWDSWFGEVWIHWVVTAFADPGCCGPI